MAHHKKTDGFIPSVFLYDIRDSGSKSATVNESFRRKLE